MTDRAAQAVAQWQQLQPELDTLPMLVLGRLAEAQNLVSQKALNPNFKAFDLQAGEFDVLMTLRRSGPPYSLAPTALYKTAMISSGSMTNRIDRLASRGYVERQANPCDRRSSLVTLTKQGKSLIDKLVPIHIATMDKIMGTFSQSEQQDLAQLLLKLIEQTRQET